MLISPRPGTSQIDEVSNFLARCEESAVWDVRSLGALSSQLDDATTKVADAVAGVDVQVGLALSGSLLGC